METENFNKIVIKIIINCYNKINKFKGIKNIWYLNFSSFDVNIVMSLLMVSIYFVWILWYGKNLYKKVWYVIIFNIIRFLVCFVRLNNINISDVCKKF